MHKITKSFPDLVTIILTILLFTVIIIPLVDHTIIYFGYGMEAYSEGLRIQNSKLGILSDGRELSNNLEFIRYICFIMGLFTVFLFIMFIDRTIIFLKKRKKQKGHLLS